MNTKIKFNDIAGNVFEGYPVTYEDNEGNNLSLRINVVKIGNQLSGLIFDDTLLQGSDDYIVTYDKMLNGYEGYFESNTSMDFFDPMGVIDLCKQSSFKRINYSSVFPRKAAYNDKVYYKVNRKFVSNSYSDFEDVNSKITFLPDELKKEFILQKRTCTMEEAIERYGYSNILRSTLTREIFDYEGVINETYTYDENVSTFSYMYFPIATVSNTDLSDICYINENNIIPPITGSFRIYDSNDTTYNDLSISGAPYYDKQCLIKNVWEKTQRPGYSSYYYSYYSNISGDYVIETPLSSLLIGNDIYCLTASNNQKFIAYKLVNPDNENEIMFKVDYFLGGNLSTNPRINIKKMGLLRIKKVDGKWRIIPEYNKFFLETSPYFLQAPINYWEETSGDFENESGMTFTYIPSENSTYTLVNFNLARKLFNNYISSVEIPSMLGNELFGDIVGSSRTTSNIDASYNNIIDYQNELQSKSERTIYVSVDPQTYTIVV